MIVLGVTPPDTLRKLNQDNVVCYTLTSNIKNDYEYDYEHVMIRIVMLRSKYMLVHQDKTIRILSMILVPPRSSSL